MSKYRLIAQQPMPIQHTVFNTITGIEPMCSNLFKRKYMNDNLKNNLDQYLTKIDFIKYNLEDIPERDRRIYFCFNMNTYVIYCIAFDETTIQQIATAISNITPNSEGIIMYDYKQY